jgi:ketosteroid isomerase-like protein
VAAARANFQRADFQGKTMSGRTDLIRGYFAAFQSGDRKIIEDVLSEDFTFTSPYDDAIDRAAYFERCWPNHAMFRQMAVEKISEDGNDAFVLYRCEMLDGRTFRNIELHRFRGGKLTSVEVFFGAGWKNGVFVSQQ